MHNPILKDENRTLKESILLASIEEFGRKSYEAASTNDIVKNAGASKGLLFHYYKNKNNLYLESVLYVMDRFAEYMEEQLDFSDRDIFSRIKNIMEVKLNFGCKYPTFWSLIEKAWYLENKKEIPHLEELFEENIDTYRNRIIWNKFYENLDTEKLRNSIDVCKVLDYIFIALEACWLRFSKKCNGDIEKAISNMDMFLAEADNVINLMKYGAYKK